MREGERMVGKTYMVCCDWGVSLGFNSTAVFGEWVLLGAVGNKSTEPFHAECSVILVLNNFRTIGGFPL